VATIDRVTKIKVTTEDFSATQLGVPSFTSSRGQENASIIDDVSTLSSNGDSVN
jgi:hypothetical protein